MTRPGHDFQRAEDLPIPRDVRPGPGWTGQMLEMADHIGAYATMQIVERYGGQVLYISLDPERNVVRDLIGSAATEVLSRVYGRERISIPSARAAVRRAKWQPILAAVRAKELSLNEATKRLGAHRTYLCHLINKMDAFDLPKDADQRRRALRALGRRDPVTHPEDWDFDPRRTAPRDRQQMDLFGEDEAE